MAGRASSPVRKVFGSPYMGVMNSLPEHEVSPNALYSASNAMFTAGQVRTRSSMVKLATVTGAQAPSFDSRPLACWSTVQSTNDFDIIVTTHEGLFRLRNLTGSWVSMLGSLNLTNNNNHTPRMASLFHQPSGQTATLFVNATDNILQSLNGNTFTDLGSGNTIIDIATVASRFMAITPPYRVAWSDIYNSTFPALNFYTAQDTVGRVIAIRNLGALGACIYKQDSIIVGYSQPGSPANAFRFEVRYEVPGPAGASAVVAAEGKLFHMTTRGRIGMFDGTRFDWIGDGAWGFLLTDFDYTKAFQTHGFYDERMGQVWFIYPRVADAGNGPTGVAIISLPRVAWGVPSYGVWPGILAVPASCSNTLRLTSGYEGLVCRSDAGNLNAEVMTDPLIYSTFGDDEVDFNCHIHTGLQATGEIIRLEIEPFVKRAADLGECTLKPVTSYTLTTDGGDVGSGQIIDLEDNPIIHGVRGFPGVSGRFAGVRLEWQSRVPEAETGPEEGGAVVYKGAAITGYGVEQP
jgi:hypothetical protein